MTRVCGLTSIGLFSILTLSACLAVADHPVSDDAEILSSGPSRRAPRPIAAARSVRLGLTILPTASLLPDGRMAIEVSGVRAGGLDPVLRVGEQVVRDYVYVRPGVARFVADVAPGATPSVSFDPGAAR